jgi:hypothetical protein
MMRITGAALSCSIIKMIILQSATLPCSLLIELSIGLTTSCHKFGVFNYPSAMAVAAFEVHEKITADEIIERGNIALVG